MEWFKGKKEKDHDSSYRNNVFHGIRGWERRLFDRQSGIGNRIEIKPLGQRPGLEVKLGANLVNISDGGLCLSQDLQWSEEQVLRLVLPIADWSTSIPTLGEVRWVKRMAANEERYLFGIQYLF